MRKGYACRPGGVSVVYEQTRDGRNAVEIAEMPGAGLSSQEALIAPTAGGAELCGVGDRLGSLRPGALFVAIVLDEDPSDLSVFASPGAVAGVLKGGVPVVPHARLAERVVQAG